MGKADGAFAVRALMLLRQTPLVASSVLLPWQMHKALLIMNRPPSALLNTELQADAQSFINDPVQLIRPHGAHSSSQPLVPHNGIIMLMWFQLGLRYRTQVLEWACGPGGLPRDSFSWERYVCFQGLCQLQKKQVTPLKVGRASRDNRYPGPAFPRPWTCVSYSDLTGV